LVFRRFKPDWSTAAVGSSIFGQLEQTDLMPICSKLANRRPFDGNMTFANLIFGQKYQQVYVPDGGEYSPSWRLLLIMMGVFFVEAPLSIAGALANLYQYEPLNCSRTVFVPAHASPRD